MKGDVYLPTEVSSSQTCLLLMFEGRYLQDSYLVKAPVPTFLDANFRLFGSNNNGVFLSRDVFELKWKVCKADRVGFRIRKMQMGGN